MNTADSSALARGLAGQGRFADALAALGPLVVGLQPAAEHLELQANILKATGDLARAVEVQRRITHLYPARRSAWHNLAASQGDLGFAEEAEAAARRCMTLGPPAPETWLVLGRALQTQGRYDEAEAAFTESLALRPAYAEAHRDLAQLLWMRTGDTTLALAALEARPGGAESDPNLALIKVAVLEFSGDLDGAAAAAAAGLERYPLDAGLGLAASNLALARGDAEIAVAKARAIAAIAPPGSPAVLAPLIQALLAHGDAAEAAQLAERWVARSPNDQLALALLLTARRALADPRRESWSDPQAVVRAYTLETPDGWPDLQTFLADLRDSLLTLHDLHSHPLHQSLRGGSQTARSLLRSTDPVIVAFFQSAQRTIDAYLEDLGPGSDPLRRRNLRGGRPRSAWSVNLRPGGRHANHVHPQGWISSAFYVSTPEVALDGPDQAGWIRFGEPAFPVRPAQAPSLAVRPAPGCLVLFPSYMWHGTAPFSTPEQRLTIAFDVLPN